jgi:predicted DNA repair protein MutK
MSALTMVGWVLDKDTSKRRIQVTAALPATVRLTVEVYGQQASVVELDDEGVVILLSLLGTAQRHLRAARQGD